MDDITIGLRLKQINRLLIREIDNMLKKYDLTFSQTELLHFLSVNGGSQPQKAIEEKFGVSHASVITLLQRTEKKGFITVTVDENDRRRRIVTLTDKVYEYFDEASEQRAEHEKRMIDGFSAQELTDLKLLLDKLYANLLKGKEC